MYIDFDALEAAFFVFICLPAIFFGLWGVWEWLTTRGSKPAGSKMGAADLMGALALIGVFGFFAWWILESRRP